MGAAPLSRRSIRLFQGDRGDGMGRLNRSLLTVAALLVSLTAAPAPASRATASSGSGGDELWVSRFNGSGNSFDSASAIALSPDGSTIFVLGDSYEAEYWPDDWATVAYDAASGQPEWVDYYGIGGEDYPQDLVVSPDGSRVYVTGWAGPGGGNSDWATVAYDSTTGTLLWRATYAPSTFIDGSRAIGVSPDGSAVYVTGLSYSGSWWDYTTIAYSASNGTRLWLRTYDGPGRQDDEAELLAVSPDGGTVYVSGYSQGDGTD